MSIEYFDAVTSPGPDSSAAGAIPGACSAPIPVATNAAMLSGWPQIICCFSSAFAIEGINAAEAPAPNAPLSTLPLDNPMAAPANACNMTRQHHLLPMRLGWPRPISGSGIAPRRNHPLLEDLARRCIGNDTDCRTDGRHQAPRRSDPSRYRPSFSCRRRTANAWLPNKPDQRHGRCACAPGAPASACSFAACPSFLASSAFALPTALITPLANCAELWIRSIRSCMAFSSGRSSF